MQIWNHAACFSKNLQNLCSLDLKKKKDFLEERSEEECFMYVYVQ